MEYITLLYRPRPARSILPPNDAGDVMSHVGFGALELAPPPCFTR